MSHHARLITPLEAVTVVTSECVTLAIDTPIKCVTLAGDGSYLFEAALVAGKRSSGWVIFRTHADLPAFTDKGAAHRARQVHATLQPGRPVAGEEHVVKPVAVRVSRTQRAWVERRAARKASTVSEYIRALLEADGMPG